MRRREAGGFGLCEVAKHWPCSRFYNLSFAVCLFTAESRCRVKGSGNFAEIAGAPFHKNEIRLCRFVPPDKSRPAVILTRGSALNYLFVDTIAPIAFSHRFRQLNHAREELSVSSYAPYLTEALNPSPLAAFIFIKTACFINFGTLMPSLAATFFSSVYSSGRFQPRSAKK